MKIIVVGGGKVGTSLTELLTEADHSVTVVDTDAATVQDVTEEYDAIGIVGNGASYSILEQAEVDQADVLVAATPTDEVNMVACLLAKKMGCANTIARIRNPEYNRQLRLLQEDLGLSLVINPELSAAQEIVGLLGFSGAESLISMVGGRVNMVRYRVQEGSPLTGRPLAELDHKKGENVIVCSVERDGEVFIPKGDFVLAAGDHAHLVGSLQNVDLFLRRMGVYRHVVRSIILVGGGKIAYYVAMMLKEANMEVKIIEKDHARCVTLAENLPHVLVVQGDGSEQKVLDSEGITETDAIVALTGMDEENLLISMYASLQNVPKVITKINRMEYVGIVERMGLDSIVSPKQSAVNNIARYVRAMRGGGGEVNAIYRLADGKAEAMELTVNENVLHIGKALKDLPLRKDVLIACIIREGRIIFPTGGDCLKMGDKLVVVTTAHLLAGVNGMFEE
ncbi:Trk system potassium transporter TrkA [Ruminococcaceae bacterium OttesenSCG-928-N02]|nr:Trk system potassium transporter TrkA [Ruminococcaceae bacterium OttesenSCG-928-N02]